VRTLVRIGSGLSSQKEFRDIFNDLAEEIIEKMRKIDLTIQEVEMFFDVLIRNFSNGAVLAPQLRQRFSDSWRRYFECVKLIVLKIFPKWAFSV